MEDLYVELKGECKAAYSDYEIALRALVLARHDAKSERKKKRTESRHALARIAEEKRKWEARMDTIAVRERQERAECEARKLSHARRRRPKGWRRGNRRRFHAVRGEWREHEEARREAFSCQRRSEAKRRAGHRWYGAKHRAGRDVVKRSSSKSSSVVYDVCCFANKVYENVL